MINKELQIELPLIEHGNRKYLVILNCQPEHGDHRLGIHLHQVSVQDGEYYVREYSLDIELVTASLVSESTLRTIYITNTTGKNNSKSIIEILIRIQKMPAYIYNFSLLFVYPSNK